MERFPDTGRSTGVYIIFYQVFPIDYGTHVSVPVAQSIAESEYNIVCTAGMALAHFSMLIHELFNKDPDIVPEEFPLIILNSKSDVCMDKNGKDTKHTSHITRRIHFVRNVEKYKIYNIELCEGGLKLADISTENIGNNGLNPIMKCLMVGLENWKIPITQFSFLI